MNSNTGDTKPLKSKPRKKSMWCWPWAWKMDTTDLNNQVDNYKTLGFAETYRGISILITLAPLIVTILASFFNFHNLKPVSTIVATVVCWGPVLYFVNKGHRWAIIVLMAFWTLERGYQLCTANVHGWKYPLPLIIWLIVMPYLWKAFRVEVERRKIAGIDKIAGDTNHISSVNYYESWGTEKLVKAYENPNYADYAKKIILEALQKRGVNPEDLNNLNLYS